MLQKDILINAVLVVALLLAFIGGMLAAQLLIDQEESAVTFGTLANVPCSFEQGGAKFVAASGCTVEVQSGGILDILNGATFRSDTFQNYKAQSALTIGAGGIITPTGTYQLVSSSVAVTTSTTTPIATSGRTAGDMLLLRNSNASDVITIDGTGGTVECKADVALGASDILLLIYNGSKWNCISSYDNS